MVVSFVTSWVNIPVSSSVMLTVYCLMMPFLSSGLGASQLRMSVRGSVASTLNCRGAVSGTACRSNIAIPYLTVTEYFGWETLTVLWCLNCNIFCGRSNSYGLSSNTALVNSERFDLCGNSYSSS